MRYRYAEKTVILLCQVMLCGLLLIGCGLPGTEGTVENTPPEQTGEFSGTEGNADKETESETEAHTTGETLPQLIWDEGLRKIVESAAKVEPEDRGETLRQKLEQCEELILSWETRETVGSLDGIGSSLPNLHSLVIDYSTGSASRIEDFTPLAELSGLRRLYIKYPAGEDMDLSFLGRMDTVTELFLVDCDLKDASFLLDMPQLECLSLYRTPVEDLAVLENLTSLVELALYGNREAKNLETVGKLSGMRDLGLQDCGIEDISFLGGLTELRGINLNYNSVTDLTPLSGLTGLERLGLAANEVSDISPLADLENLFDLALDGNHISDISALKDMPYLNQVGLSGNQIRDLSPLADKPELLYVSLAGNPCSDPAPVLQVPLLRFGGMDASGEQLKIVRDWMAKHRPDVEEYQCIDYSEADLDGDGLPDAAFVLCDEPAEWGELFIENHTRHLYILLQQKDGSWKELENNISISNPDSGGMRGDSYRGMCMGNGYVLIQHGWGSSSGTTETDVYQYRQGELELVWSMAVDDYSRAAGYDVRACNEKEGTWIQYAIAMDGWRMARVDYATDEHPAYQRAFPRLALDYGSYYLHADRLPTAMSGAEVLEYFRDTVEGDWEQEKLPYEYWQKQGYELLKGVELPDYYYVVQKSGGEERDAREEYIFYYDLEKDGGEYYHVIRYVKDGSAQNVRDEIQDYRINDSTGRLEEE